MSHQSNLIADDIQQYLKQHEEKDLLRFITCGSVDDGKSTLIGRLLHDTKMIYEDQLAAISKDSKTHGTTGEKIDLALLVDGLQSEREQGITIDVAYRYFSTDKRKFIIADTPGHEQYTRNMATGASTTSLAILLIDARYGVQTQTRRHSFICSLLGIKNFVIAVNKMDLMDFSEARFEEIKQEYQDFAKNLNVPNITFIPISALDGDNVADNSQRSPWYKGESLLSILENVEIQSDNAQEHARFPVQYVNRPNLNFRGFCGTVAAGSFKPGQAVKALPSNKTSTVKQVVTFEGEQAAAYAGDAVTLTLNDEIDISRGDMIVAAEDAIQPSNTLLIDVVWMHDSPLELNKNYYVKVGTTEVSGAITDIEYQIDVNTLEQKKVDTLPINGIARCTLELTEAVAADAYHNSRFTGNLIFIDRLSNVTVGAGMVCKALASSSKDWSSVVVDREARAGRYHQKASLLVLSDLGDANKQAVESLLEKQLFVAGYDAYWLKQGENAGLAAKVLLDAGHIVIASKELADFSDSVAAEDIVELSAANTEQDVDQTVSLLMKKLRSQHIIG